MRSWKRRQRTRHPHHHHRHQRLRQRVLMEKMNERNSTRSTQKASKKSSKDVTASSACISRNRAPHPHQLSSHSLSASLASVFSPSLLRTTSPHCLSSSRVFASTYFFISMSSIPFCQLSLALLGSSHRFFLLFTPTLFPCCLITLRDDDDDFRSILKLLKYVIRYDE